MVIVDWIGLGQSASGLGWIGFNKMDPCPTLLTHMSHMCQCHEVGTLALDVTSVVTFGTARRILPRPSLLYQM